MIAALPCILALVVCSFCINETMLYSPDSTNYMSWAHSLARLGGFCDRTGPESARYVFNAPLYPVLLAPVSLVFPWSIPAAKIVTLITGLVMLAAFQFFLARRLPPGAALGAGLFLAINPLFILYSTQILSDIPFAACCVIAIALLERVVPEGGRRRWTTLLIAALCGALFLREVGFAFVFASAFVLFLRRRFRPLLLLLIAVALTYGLWFFRNEILVARAEHPGLRNMSLVFSHVFTASDASPAAEIGARIARSFTFYGPGILSLITAPFDVAWTYSVTDTSDRLFAAVQWMMGILRWPLAAVTLIPVALGARTIARNRVLAPFLAALVPAYGAIIIAYPVSDIRFLFPVLLLLLWCAAAGIANLLASAPPGRRRLARTAVVALLAAAALPNLAWVRNVVMSNVEYRADPGAYTTAHAKSDPYPEELLLIPRPAARFIDGDSPRETVVGSKVKSAALWLDGRPLVLLNPLLPVEEFDNRIRDYGIAYVMCELQSHQVPDYALQMALSTRHVFTPAFEFADVRVYRVSDKTDPRQASLVGPKGGYGAAEEAFLRGVYALANGEGSRAVPVFEAMEHAPGVETMALFYEAVAREFAMDLDTAERLFLRFRTIPQSAAYLAQAQIHENVIALLRGAAESTTGEEKGARYQEAAMTYWILGFRTQAVIMLREALRVDPGNFSGEVFGAVFSLAIGDTAGARQGVRLAERAGPTNPLTLSLRSIMACIDSLPAAPRKAPLETAIGRHYAAMGLYEIGIDQALKALREGEDRDALRLLADMYLRKDRRAPALGALRRLEKLGSPDPALRDEIRTFERVPE